ncbi:hypothetical protein SLS53_000677 [Cytospora paraplurivora]|uniref:Phosphoribosyltransferase domain-containing protein n=1 Tax=Cytospora paraplurivora TaxID=2898453 RepID=A0AAN9YLH4_9PEZI
MPQSHDNLGGDSPQGPLSAATPLPGPTIHGKPTIVGIYGIQGCGKTTLINHLKQELPEKDFSFFDGSQMLASVIQGGLDTFQQMNEAMQAHHRGLAIQAISQQCSESGRVGVVAGHLTLWVENEAKPVFTQSDLDTYTHILYVEVPATEISDFRRKDTSRTRTEIETRVLERWQKCDKIQTKEICRQNEIMFATVPHSVLQEKTLTVEKYLMDIRDHTEGENMRRALKWLDHIITPSAKTLDRVLVLDGDKTLTSVDATTLFWEAHIGPGSSHNPLKEIFSHKNWQYSYKAFRQAAWLYEEIPWPEFRQSSVLAAHQVRIHTEFERLLLRAREKPVRAILVTSGVGYIWETVMQNSGLDANVSVIGGGRIMNGFVVTPDIKAAIVNRLREHHGLRVYAFGDSAVDIPMLKAADEAFIVSGELETRSKTMDRVLPIAIRDGLRAKQLLLPRGAPPRLDESVLPIAQFDDAFINNILGNPAKQRSPVRHIHATETAAAKLLMTPMRDAELASVALRAAHQRAGWWVATQLVSEVIGLGKTTIAHVQGHPTSGHQLLDEQKTVIVALMRGGEPMAFGVSEAFPSAMFVHADTPEDVKEHHITGQKNLILVDSVVNSGATVVDFLRHIRLIHKSLRIVVVAGVIQARFFKTPPEAVADDINVSIVALRLSDNEFKGKRGTDTGNRLFNTTHLD